MTKDEALRMALEALHGFIPYLPLNDEAQCGRYDQAITAIKEALSSPNGEAQPEQEPVACVGPWHNGRLTLIPRYSQQTFERDQPLYTTPPQRTWVGLTEDEAFACKGRDYFETYKAIEAKLKEKNSA